MALKIRRPFYYPEGSLKHSAKGSTWEDHKYVKVVDGTYYYPDGYEGGRHLGDSKSKYGEYDKNDPDFAQSNYDEKNRLGDTDFFGFTKPDGTVVILEEDMKWSLPAGADLKEMTKRLTEFSNRASNGQFSAEDWRKEAKKAIDGGESSGSGNDTDKMADDVIKGKYGNGSDRKTALGQDYDEVQKKVNERLKAKKLKHSMDKNDHYTLYHHGILGMKWGKKNGPPYPLGPGDHSAAEKKAKKDPKGFREKLKKGAKVAAGAAAVGGATAFAAASYMKKANTPKLSGPTEEPRKMSDMSDKELADYNKRKSLENQYKKLSGQEKTKLDMVKDATDSTANSLRQVKNMLNEGGNKKPEKIRPDLSEMSDKELRDAINRENLERQYTDMFGEEKVDKTAKGKEYAAKILAGTVGALTIANAGIQIAIGIRALKGGK